jgi:sulfur carrier protein
MTALHDGSVAVEEDVRMERNARQVRVNGEAMQTDAQTVAGLLASLGVDDARTGVAVARNGEVVRRSQWTETPLHDGDTVEVLRAVQGG